MLVKHKAYGHDGASIIVEGGECLSGSVDVQGSKAVGVILYAAAFAVDGSVTIENAPGILDTGVAVSVAGSMNRQAEFDGSRLRIEPIQVKHRTVIPSDLGSQIRVTPTLAAGILSRQGRVSFPLPGGDAFCARPIDLHLSAMRSAGANISQHQGTVTATLRGGRPNAFTFSARGAYGPSVGATATALLLAARAKGTSVVLHASPEPEIRHLVHFLRRCGNKVAWTAHDALQVEGVSELADIEYRLPEDGIEAGTLAIAAAITYGKVTINADLRMLPTPFLDFLGASGTTLRYQDGRTEVFRDSPGRTIDIETGQGVGFPTDLQPQSCVLLTQLPGISRVTERVYPSRASHVSGLQSYGAEVRSTGSVTTVTGPTPLRAANVSGNDVRAAVSFLLAALVADGRSVVHGLHHIRRGHASLLQKFASLGARITVEAHPEK